MDFNVLAASGWERERVTNYIWHIKKIHTKWCMFTTPCAHKYSCKQKKTKQKKHKNTTHRRSPGRRRWTHQHTQWLYIQAWAEVTFVERRKFWMTWHIYLLCNNKIQYYVFLRRNLFYCRVPPWIGGFIMGPTDILEEMEQGRCPQQYRINGKFMFMFCQTSWAHIQA